ncbi:cytochrome c oxidase subunit II [Sphaerisporangium fuscum]|uniref:cytochrome c oxidase subunit II n=1 Tax=Sphaerisporangium fuscum TaxID=2835868 RepID=UPI001BDDB0A4|nr:cytochrome c oxidase subunit II [Sphaerisporangium fuscum]
MTWWRVARLACAMTWPALLLLAGCGGSGQSTLAPAGDGSRRVAALWWLLFGISVVVIAVIVVLVLWAAWRRRGPGVKVRLGSGQRLVLVAGVVLPAIVLVFVYVVSLPVLRSLGVRRDPGQVVVEVTGHQWWWEVRYPGTSAVTANEIHVPVGRTVHLRLATADVNHSFWAPAFTVKTDLVAGRVNDLWLRADHAGVFRGQCAEYCGSQHARMAFHIVAQPPDAFAAWLAGQARPAAAPARGAAALGLRVLQSAACASCHTVRGTTANGRIGPDLTHVASRRFLAAGAVPNTRGFLAGWIADSQTIKPGNKMPPQPLPSQQLQALIAYLESLR